MMRKEYLYIADTILWCFVATASIVGAIQFNNIWLVIPVAISEAKLGLIAHEACHHVSGAWPVLQLLYDCALSSRQMWIANHNRGHHVFTNTSQDPDMQASPLLRLLHILVALLPAASLHVVPLPRLQPRGGGVAPLLPIRASHGGARLALAPAVPRARGGRGGGGGGCVHCGKQARRRLRSDPGL